MKEVSYVGNLKKFYTIMKNEFQFSLPHLYDYQVVMSEQYKNQLQELDYRIEYALRFLIKPVIKGKITKGKIKWRGIKKRIFVANDNSAFINGEYGGNMIYNTDHSGMRLELYCLEQRGKKILLFDSPKIYEDYQKWKILNHKYL